MEATAEESKQSILIVDDAPQNLQFLGAILRKENYQLYVAKTGEQALKIANETLPDLILLDVVLPDKDGFTVCKELKKQPETRDIPIIFLTGLTDTENIVKGFEIGGADYITKPFDPTILLARTRTHLTLHARTKQLMQYAVIDGLTLIANRRRFDEFLQQEYNRCLRQNFPISLILADVDYFKRYNDHYGHLKGDEVLKMVSHALQQVVRRPSDLVARYGGEEFGIVLGNTQLDAAKQIAEKALNVVKDINIVHEKSEVYKVITLSIGLATVTPSREFILQDLIKAADEQLYQAKASGRNQLKAMQI